MFTGDSCSKEYCERLVSKLYSVKDLPAGCQAYPAVVQRLESKEKAASDPFAGMAGGAQARRARTKGMEHHAQIQRRLTSLGQRRFSNKQE